MLACDESLWDARSLHPRQLRRLAKDLRFWYSNKFCIGALKPEGQKNNQFKLEWSLSYVRPRTHPGREAQDLVTNRPCR